MFTKALLEVSIEGLGKNHRTSVFPCTIFQCMKGVNREPGDPNYDLFRLALKSTAQRLYPNYMCCDWSVDQHGNELDAKVKQEYLNSLTASQMHELVEWCEKNPELASNFGFEVIKDDIIMKKVILKKDYINQNSLASSMGCRTYNGFDINFDVAEAISLAEKGHYQFSGNQKDSRGNICPVTIILPTLAMEAKECFMNEYDDSIVDVFMAILDSAINDAKDMLIERFDWICSQKPESAKFMYENNVIAGYIPEEGIRSALKHGTLAVG